MVTFEGAVPASQQVPGSVPTALSSITESFQQVLDSLDAARIELRDGAPGLLGADEDRPEVDRASWFGRSPRMTDVETTRDLLLPFASRPPLAPQQTAVGFEDTGDSRTPWSPYEARAAVAVEPLWARGTDSVETQPSYETLGGQGMPLAPPTVTFPTEAEMSRGGSGAAYGRDGAAEAPQSAAERPHEWPKGRGRPRLLIKSSRFTGPLGVGAVSGLIVASSMLTNGFMEAVPSWLAAQADRSSPEDRAPSPAEQWTDEGPQGQQTIDPGASDEQKRLLQIAHAYDMEADGHYNIEVRAAAARFQS